MASGAVTSASLYVSKVKLNRAAAPGCAGKVSYLSGRLPGVQPNMGDALGAVARAGSADR